MRVRPIAINLLMTVVIPLLAVNLLTARGVSVVNALVISAIFPALETVVTWIRTRRLDPLGALSLAFIALGTGASLLSGDAHFALAKESFFTAVFGLICLGSLLAPRPIMFAISRTFQAGGDPAREALWTQRWAIPQFRRVMRVMTAVWGITYVAEAALRVALVYALPVSISIVVSPLLATATTVALVIWTVGYGRSAERRGLERRAQAERLAAAAPQPGA